MKKMYTVGIPITIQFSISLFYGLGLWIGKMKHRFRYSGRQLLYLFYYFGFVISIVTGVIGAIVTGKGEEATFLAAALICSLVQLYRLFFIIQRQEKVRMLIDDVGIHCTNGRNEYVLAADTLTNFMTLPKCFSVVAGCAFFCSVLAPICTNENALIFNIGYRMEWEERSTIEYWLGTLFIVGGLFLSSTCCFLTITVWYLMISFIIKYRVLGNLFRNLGKGRTTSYEKDLIATIKIHEEISEKITIFSSMFANLFLLQIVTSSISLCASIFGLIFSSHDNLVRDAMNGLVICYSLFDIVMITYLGNEITHTSDRLSYCIFESNWCEQRQSCKKLILIITEMLRKPQELVVGVLFPLNLTTFTLIVKRAYSAYNVLLGAHSQ